LGSDSVRIDWDAVSEVESHPAKGTCIDSARHDIEWKQSRERVLCSDHSLRKTYRWVSLIQWRRTCGMVGECPDHEIYDL